MGIHLEGVETLDLFKLIFVQLIMKRENIVVLPPPIIHTIRENRVRNQIN